MVASNPYLFLTAFNCLLSTLFTRMDKFYSAIRWAKFILDGSKSSVLGFAMSTTCLVNATSISDEKFVDFMHSINVVSCLITRALFCCFQVIPLLMSALPLWTPPRVIVKISSIPRWSPFRKYCNTQYKNQLLEYGKEIPRDNPDHADKYIREIRSWGRFGRIDEFVLEDN